MNNKIVIRLAMLFFLILALSSTAYAGVYNKWGINEYAQYRVDLNKDGKIDVIKFVDKMDNLRWDSILEEWEGDPYQELYINGKKLLQVRNTPVHLGDINKKDKYIELIVGGTIGQATTVYRYNGKQLIKTYSWKPIMGKHSIKSLLKKNNKYGGYYYKANGDGTVTLSFPLSNKKFANPAFSVLGRFKVTKKGLPLIAGKSNPSVDVVLIYKAPQKWYLYKNTKTRNNRLIKTIKKGTKIMFLKAKFNKKYTCILVKELNSKKKGWVFLKTSTCYAYNEAS